MLRYPQTRSHTHIYVYYSWTTKHRRPFLQGEIADQLSAFIHHYCAARNIDLMAVTIHRECIELIVRLFAVQAPAAVIRQIKGASSRWLNQQNLCRARFAWQEGYGAYSISLRDLGPLMRSMKRRQVRAT